MRLSIAVLLTISIIGCVNKKTIVKIEDINVIRTSRDSSYTFQGKLFSGEIIQFDEKGNTIKSFTTENGKINGVYKAFYTNGSKKIFAEYHSGILNGEKINYYSIAQYTQ